jgi:cytosine/adenosine deaminase-related metal-dependent hydrolase
LNHQTKRLSVGAALFFALLFAFSPRLVAAQHKPPTAFVDVNVVPMDREVVLSHQTVVVEDGKIVALGPAHSVKIPVGSQRIDGTNRFLMPGLVDMHVHFIRPAIPGNPQKSSAATYAKENEQLALLFVANGVTTVRNMWGHPEILKLNDHILSGEILGPTIYSVGPITDGDPPVNMGSRVVITEQEAQEAVREDKERGYIAIKIYNNLSLSAYRAITAAAAKEHLPVVGHVPRAVGLTGALEAHQASLEHFGAGGFPRAALPDGTPQDRLSLNDMLERADLSKLPATAKLVKTAGVWTCPTVVLVQRDAANDIWARARSFVPSDLVERYETEKLPPLVASSEAFALAVVRALHSEGAGLLLGTDTYKPNVIPGFSLQEELTYFVKAGLSPYDAIRAGTSDAARFLHRENEFGTVAVGRRADLLLLTANPLESVGNVANRVGLMLRGDWLSEGELQIKLKQPRSVSAESAEPKGGRP